MKPEIVDQWSTRIPLAPTEKKVNDLYDLDLWPIDLEIVHDTSSPPGLHLGLI